MKTYAKLIEAGIPCTVVLDSAVAYVMDRVDFVLVGSEAVVESGGLINAVGSNQIAILAQAARKPFYALSERYGFLLVYGLAYLSPLASEVINFIVFSRFRNTICPLIRRAYCLFQCLLHAARTRTITNPGLLPRYHHQRRATATSSHKGSCVRQQRGR